MKIGRRALALALSLALLCSCAADGTGDAGIRADAGRAGADPPGAQHAGPGRARAGGRVRGGRRAPERRAARDRPCAPGERPPMRSRAGRRTSPFCATRRWPQLDERFSTFALPFLYDDHQHLSLALNSEELLGRLNTGLQPRGIRLLNAFYSGSAFLVSTKGELRTPSDYKGIAAALRTDNADKLAVFSSLGRAGAALFGLRHPQHARQRRRSSSPRGRDGPAEEVTVDTIEVDTEPGARP